MVYQKKTSRLYSGSSTGNLSYFGTGLDGALTVSASATVGTGNDDSAVLVSNYTTLTVNSGQSLSPAGRRRAWIIYVQGDCVVNGYITMASGASAVASQVEFIRDTPDSIVGINNLNKTVQFVCPATGATGGAGRTTDAPGNAGSAGTNGQTGGGGAGGAAGEGSSGSGGTGTAFSGGPGGGAGNSGSAGTAGGANGGAGGAGGQTGIRAAGGGAGNPGGIGGIGGIAGASGTGGTVALIVGGNLTIGASAIISANGSRGGTAISGPYPSSGGGSGGGRVIILYAGTVTNNGTTQANGGLGGVSGYEPGGAGGAGSVTSPTRVS